MPSCAVFHCKNRTERGFRLFSLPRGVSNVERRLEWLKFINREDVPESAKICEVHFEEEQFELKRQDGKKLLKWNAIPTVQVSDRCFKEKNTEPTHEPVVEEDEEFPTNLQFQNLKRKLKIAYKKIKALEKQLRESKACQHCNCNALQKTLNFNQVTALKNGTRKGVEIEVLPTNEKVERADTKILPPAKYEKVDKDNEERKVLSISFEHNYSLGMEETDLKQNNQSISDTLASYNEQCVTENVHFSAVCENKIEMHIDKLEEESVSIKEEPSINNVTDTTEHYDTSNKWWLIDLGIPYECRICNSIFDKYDTFYSHVHSHFVQESICINCGIKFPFGKLNHHKCGQNENDYLCVYCLIVFNTAEDLEKHNMLSHLDEKLFLCKICGQEFNEKSALEVHERNHIRVPQFVCEYCGKTFMGLRGYKKHKQKFHLNIVADSETHECDRCKKVFSNSISLIRHYKAHSTKVPNFKCEICDSTFMLSFTYNVHMFLHKVRMSTFNSISFNCKFCFDIFTNKEAFEKHLLNHIEKPYQCNQCHKFFSSKMKLKQHLVHHSEEKRYCCEYCSKTFKIPSTLSRHKRSHIGKRPYVCKVCSRSFIQKVHLTSHMLTHTGEKKYVCQYCGRAFALNGSLTVHVRRHTGDTPFHCDTCGKAFYDCSTLKKHTLWKHKR